MNESVRLYLISLQKVLMFLQHAGGNECNFVLFGHTILESSIFRCGLYHTYDKHQLPSQAQNFCDKYSSISHILVLLYGDCS